MNQKELEERLLKESNKVGELAIRRFLADPKNHYVMEHKECQKALLAGIEIGSTECTKAILSVLFDYLDDGLEDLIDQIQPTEKDSLS